MKTAIRSVVLASMLATGVAGAATVDVGGAAMSPLKNIVQNALNSKDHTTLVAAVKAAGLVDTLESKGPFTVFAPTNEAFNGLPAGTLDTLLKPENKDTLTKILTYHVVPGKYTKHDLENLIKKHDGKAMLKTASGGMLNGPQNIQIKDASNRMAMRMKLHRYTPAWI